MFHQDLTGVWVGTGAVTGLPRPLELRPHSHAAWGGEAEGWWAQPPGPE